MVHSNRNVSRTVPQQKRVRNLHGERGGLGSYTVIPFTYQRFYLFRFSCYCAKHDSFFFFSFALVNVIRGDFLFLVCVVCCLWAWAWLMTSRTDATCTQLFLINVPRYSFNLRPYCRHIQLPSCAQSIVVRQRRHLWSNAAARRSMPPQLRRCATPQPASPKSVI